MDEWLPGTNASVSVFDVDDALVEHDRAAAIYSFFVMCKKEAVNPYEWLRHLFENIGDTTITRLDTLYPKNSRAVRQDVVCGVRNSHCRGQDA